MLSRQAAPADERCDRAASFIFGGLLIGYIRILRSVPNAASVRAQRWISLLIDRTIPPHQGSGLPDALAKFVARL
jgi:hypothetical protein